MVPTRGLEPIFPIDLPRRERSDAVDHSDQPMALSAVEFDLIDVLCQLRQAHERVLDFKAVVFRVVPEPGGLEHGRGRQLCRSRSFRSSLSKEMKRDPRRQHDGQDGK